MNVGYLHVGPNTDLVNSSIDSVRRVMPHAKVTLMTDSETPEIDCDTRIEKEYDGLLMPYRLLHLSCLPEGEWLFLDTDTIVLRDVSSVFRESFDVALTKRDIVIDPNGVNLAETMPYNTGVMFSTSKNFWEECYRACKGFHVELKKWWGDQLAVRLVAKHEGFDEFRPKRKFKVLELDVDPYNFTPHYGQEHLDYPDKYILHYKGKRKEWMLKKFGRKTRAETDKSVCI